MKQDELLMIPGPTPLPDVVRQAMARPAIGHRSPEFKEVMKRVLPKLQWAFGTKSDVLLITASATGAFEAAMVNTLNRGDKILVLSCGVFSERWADMGETLGLEVQRIAVPAGQANTVDSLKKALAQDTDKSIKAVIMTHSETSTGVLNPVKALAAEVKAHGALCFVDSVTSLTATDFDFDGWGIDLCVSGSQKGFMIPPGLAFLAISPKAWQAFETCKYPGYYFNFKQYKKAQDQSNTPYTPATHLILALEQALLLMEQEGMEQRIARHQKLQQMVRSGIKALGLSPLVEADGEASTAVTSVLPPDGIAVADIRSGLKNGFGIIVADGQKDLKGKIFRIGHLGYVFDRDVYGTLSALETVLANLGVSVTPGAAAAAAKAVAAACGESRQPAQV
ncbi:MAG: alanine--glyoxylate aminotransferase family protein [Vampirovibrio sp.]|nr:alanine--glyoxylate aminotransferase family protein [Vampirovibrio sp.]